MTVNVRFNIQRGSFNLECDLILPAQDITAILGASGSGKTTLLRAIAGLDQHPDGAISVDEEVWQNETDFKPPHLRSVAYVFQEASLFDHMTVLANLDYAVKRANDTVSGVEMDKAIELLELAPLLQKQPTVLSGGERQRVAIGRALCAKPKLLLMDEPLAGLDPAAKSRLLPLLESVLRELGITCLYVSHSLDEVSQLANNVVVLEAGKVAAHGDIQFLLTQLDLPLAQYDGAESIVPAIVANHDENYGITYLESDIGRLAMLRKSHAIGDSVRVRVLARDISLTLSPQTDTSILNIFAATVAQLQPFGESQVTVKLLLNKTPLLARITRKSADSLNLKKGLQVYAQVKTVTLF